MTYPEILRTAQLGPEAWLEEQFALPASYHLPLTREIGRLVGARGAPILRPFYHHRIAWWTQTIKRDDLLRQRVALALSEIFVVSDRAQFLGDRPESLSSFYDVLLRNAFGNYRDLLRDVTLHPAMGYYLSHLNNDRGDPEIPRFPDENFAREVMQLFSIGLYGLNADGTQKLDEEGRPVTTYSNREITEFAKAFTGLGSGAADGRFGALETVDFTVPMRMYDDHHEPGEKRLLRGFVTPDSQSGMEDVEDAVDNLFDHPNVGPFFGRLLIQRLVTSNPSREYVARVAAAFADNGEGVRGDMRAVLRAILLDPEARETPAGERFGHVQEPFVRYVRVVRTLGANSRGPFVLNTGGYADFFLGQHALSSPSVFNFFSPDYQPTGVLADEGLVAPEMQVTTSSTILSVSNLMQWTAGSAPVLGHYAVNQLSLDCAVGDCEVEPLVCGELGDDAPRPCLPALFYDAAGFMRVDWTELEATAKKGPSGYLDRLDLLFTGGSLSERTRQTIESKITQIDHSFGQARTGLFLLLLSPDFAVAN